MLLFALMSSCVETILYPVHCSDEGVRQYLPHVGALRRILLQFIDTGFKVEFVTVEVNEEHAHRLHRIKSNGTNHLPDAADCAGN